MRSPPAERESVAIQLPLASPRRLTLVGVTLSRVDFALELDDETERGIWVHVGSASSWHRAVQFPHGRGEAGETTGDLEVDHEIRRRAGEELVRLDATLAAQTQRRLAWVVE